MSQQRLHLRLPATSANLGPALDTAAVALDMYLDLTAEISRSFAIDATGRNADACSRLEDNMLLRTYQQTLEENGRAILPLHLAIQNAIPFGMGCGSSAAARLAGTALAAHFGELGWDSAAILAAACRLEGHPDNAAACWMGGMTVAAVVKEDQTVSVPTIAVPVPSAWSALLVLPSRPLPTSVSRSALPAQYSRQDALANLQRASLLVAAFAQGRGDLLHWAMQDSLHQPYRAAMCPLLPRLVPLVGQKGVLGVALSGAGPAVLMVLDTTADRPDLYQSLHNVVAEVDEVEIIACKFAPVSTL
jgi:homoserine kinase